MTTRGEDWISTLLARRIKDFGQGYAKLLSLENYQAFR